MTRTKTLAAGDSLDIGRDWARLMRVQVENRPSSVGTLYYGDIPAEAITRTGVEASAGDDFITLANEADGLAIEPGMAVSGGNSNLDPAAVVTSVKGAKVYLSPVNVDSESGLSVTFTAPAISATNGHELAPGQRESFAHGHFQTGRGIRLVAGTGDCTVTITEARN